VQEALRNGDCWLEYNYLIKEANRILKPDKFNSLQLIGDQLTRLIDDEELICRHYRELSVALPKIYKMEKSLARIFRHIRERSAGIPEYDDFEPELNNDQRIAAQNAFRFSISLMTGGAGTGKTYTIRSVIKVAERIGLNYELAAPTGKAAKRLEQSVGGDREAQTIHRLLKFDGKTYQKEAIETDLVIIDEISMVDVTLMYYLLRAIDYSRTRVLLVGDNNQLPPVGPGNVLRDLVDSQAIPTTELQQNIRQAGILKQNSKDILKGVVRTTTYYPHLGNRPPWRIIDCGYNPDQTKNCLIRLFKHVLTEEYGFNLLRDVQVLTPTKKREYPLGSFQLNVLLQRIIQKKLFGIDIPTSQKKPEFLPNDKIIQTKNDYGLEVMNGTLGIVIENDQKHGLVVDFDGDRFALSEEQERNIQLAYATTVHKMQGSEFPCAIVIIHNSHRLMHNRNLLYTAVTRAQHCVIVIGDKKTIQKCAENTNIHQRKTFLQYFLRSKDSNEGSGVYPF
jgi:exodeoxyribonuclease V alpha subunit